VDYELQGCPVNKHQLLEVIGALRHSRIPAVPSYSVCMECKRKGIVCVTVARGTPCLGPVTRAGCGALCPSYHRGCYGCFGPKESPNTSSLSLWWKGSPGMKDEEIVRAFRGFNAYADSFRKESEFHEN
jgi:coenzyme F420-reducing hydrogenase gamma subunit